MQTTWPATGYNFQDPSAIPPPGMYHLQRAGVVVNAHSLLSIDVVYTALRIISNNILRMGDLLPFTWGWSNDNIKYPQYIKDPRPILSNTFGGGGLGGQAGTIMQCTGRDRTIWSMGLFGEAFWFILRDPEYGLPIGVEVLHPAFMEVEHKEGKIRFTYGTGNNKIDLPAENVMHIPMKSLPGSRRSLAPTDYAGIAGALAMAAYEFGSSWFAQGQAPDFILTTDQKLGQEEVERIANKFMIRHGGLTQAHLPVVLDSGMDIKEAMIAPDKAQFLNTLDYTRQVVGAWFGIPPSKLGNALQRAPMTPPHVRQEEQVAFVQDTLTGYTFPLEEVHSALLPQNEFACFDEHKLTKPDAQFLAQMIQALRVTQAGSINDVRVRELGWGPVPGGDDVLAPLASNTAPSQTGNQGVFPKGKSKNSGSSGPSDDEREVLSMIARRLAQPTVSELMVE